MARKVGVAAGNVAAGNRGKGRKKGVPNKTTAALKDMILRALDKSGGVDYLVEKAESEPKAFMTLLGRVLPLQVTGQDDGPIRVTVTRYAADQDTE